MDDDRGVPSFHIDDVHRAEQDLMVRLLDDQARLPGVERLRRWVRDALAVRPGETVVDLGSGTGTEVVELARSAGEQGRAVGVEPNPSMLALARERAAGKRAEFVEGSAYTLPFPDAEVDVVRCERVYQHLDDPAKATAEIARVLRPGGRVALIDSDWATAILHPGDQRVVDALRERMSAGIPHPHSGRRLRGLLAAAGFVIDDLGSEAVVWDAAMLLPMSRVFLESGISEDVVTAEERDRLLADLEHGIEVGDHHFSVTMFAVVAHKP